MTAVPGEWIATAVEMGQPPPVTVAARTLFDRQPQAVWLDSARTSYGLGRWSILGVPDADPRTAVVWSDPDRGGGSPDPFERLQVRLRAHPVDPGSLPVPFLGGFVGYLGYGAKRLTGHGPSPDPSGPDVHLVELSRFVAYDHEERRAWAVAVGPPDRASTDRATVWAANCVQRLRAAAGGPRQPPQALRDRPAEGTAGLRSAVASVDAVTYRRHLAEVGDWLRAGDSYEACYTYQLREAFDDDPLAAYLRLRTATPAPYGAFLRLGRRSVLSASPERFLTVSPAGWACTRPIKGTAARYADPDVDAEAARQLPVDVKTRSESLMIVDLLRNDLARVCDAGTVSVPTFMTVESYATVHQLVSEVRGRLRPGLTAVDAARALFPGGSMTGAPKERTVQLLDALEPAPRGVYSGALGYFSRTGAADLSVVIRTAVVDDGVVSVGTGGAVTVLSDPDDEYAETLLKSVPLLAQLGLEHPFAARPPVGIGDVERWGGHDR
jgi:para-aminobenzoate synthetase